MFWSKRKKVIRYKMIRLRILFLLIEIRNACTDLFVMLCSRVTAASAGLIRWLYDGQQRKSIPTAKLTIYFEYHSYIRQQLVFLSLPLTSDLISLSHINSFSSDVLFR